MKKNKKVIFYLIIPALLLLLGIGSSFLFNSLSFTTLTYSHSAENIVSDPGRYFQKDDKIIIEVIGRENNLGIVSVNFEKYQGYNFIEEDRLMFKIRRDLEEEWIYENIYGIGGFERSFTLPFGFPLISDSKDKKFIIEIISTTGQKSNSVVLSTRDPGVQSTYKFSSAELLSSPVNMLSFLTRKFVLSFTNINFLYSSIIFFMPLVLYLFFVLFINREGIVRRILFYLVFPVFIIDSFILSEVDTGLVLLAIGIWTIAVFNYKFESSVSYLFSVFVLLAAIPAIILGEQNVVEKLSTYLFLFLSVGFIQSINEFRSNSKKVGYIEFIKDIIKINGKN